ncbi:Chemotaxis protein [uncultured Gammaproteobacteria bacterium]
MSGAGTFLVVDDARLARKMVRTYVAKARPDIAIEEATNGAEALQLLDGVSNLTYVTIDYNMPGMTGIDLAKIIRERCPAAHIALLTGNIQAPLRRRAAEIGVGFIGKPVDEAKISAFVTEPAAVMCFG